MNDKITELLKQISEIEDQIDDILQYRQEQLLYFIEDGKIRFKEGIVEAHRQLKMNVFNFLIHSKLRNLLSAPFIYSMIIPFALLDIMTTIYQWICFSLYGISKVRRSSFIIIDRHLLKHLNSIERLNCIYCGYANGVIAFTREVAARTEQYWCPIKHARKVIGRHNRYHDFIEYGDAENYHERLRDFRKRMMETPA